MQHDFSGGAMPGWCVCAAHCRVSWPVPVRDIKVGGGTRWQCQASQRPEACAALSTQWSAPRDTRHASTRTPQNCAASRLPDATACQWRTPKHTTHTHTQPALCRHTLRATACAQQINCVHSLTNNGTHTHTHTRAHTRAHAQRSRRGLSCAVLAPTTDTHTHVVQPCRGASGLRLLPRKCWAAAHARKRRLVHNCELPLDSSSLERRRNALLRLLQLRWGCCGGAGAVLVTRQQRQQQV